MNIAIHYQDATKEQRSQFGNMLSKLQIDIGEVSPPDSGTRESVQAWVDSDRRTVVDQVSEMFGVSRSLIIRLAISIGMTAIMERLDHELE